MSKVTLHTDKVLVLDDALPEVAWRAVWDNVSACEDYSPKDVLAEWTKVWHWETMPPVSSVRTYWYSDSPFGKYPDVVGDLFLQAARRYPDLAGAFKELRLHTHLIPHGAGISLHRDGHAAGSFTYYPHPVWEPGWGGELFVPDVAGDHGEHPGHRYGSAYRREDLPDGMDVGVYVAPRPNRLVLTAPRVYHSVNRVSPAAGDNLRVAVVGFLYQERPVKERREGYIKHA